MSAGAVMEVEGVSGSAKEALSSFYSQYCSMRRRRVRVLYLGAFILGIAGLVFMCLDSRWLSVMCFLASCGIVLQGKRIESLTSQSECERKITEAMSRVEKMLSSNDRKIGALADLQEIAEIWLEGKQALAAEKVKDFRRKYLSLKSLRFLRDVCGS